MTTYFRASTINEKWKEERSQWMTHCKTFDLDGNQVDDIPDDTTTLIICNGSKWFGQPPDGLIELYHALETEPLDPSFEKYGNFISMQKGWLQTGFKFFGNFANLSHCFDIETTDREVIDNLIALITANQNSPEYRELKA